MNWVILGGAGVYSGEFRRLLVTVIKGIYESFLGVFYLTEMVNSNVDLVVFQRLESVLR